MHNNTIYPNFLDNLAERSIRDMVMGKKAYLFCQNDLSCSHAAEMYSFFGACKVLGKNPEHWLTYALKHINTWPKDRLEVGVLWKIKMPTQ